MSFNTPILFLIFNRPDVTEKVFAEIKKQKPKYLFVAADGARENKPGEKEKCEETRNIILKNIDWDCELKTLFRNENLGCGKAVSSAITWFFENVEEGIILEDDCLPDPSFFNFCAVLLHKYRNDNRVFSIAGSNFQDGIKRGDGSYYFSRYPYIWGWATWRRSWLTYDYEIKEFNNFVSNNTVKTIFKNQKVQQYWINHFLDAKNIDTWDFQWVFNVWNKDGIAIVPNASLIKNIGFGNDATHTKNNNTQIENIPLSSITTIIHPSEVSLNIKADQYAFDHYYDLTPGEEVSFFKKILSKAKKALNSIQ